MASRNAVSLVEFDGWAYGAVTFFVKEFLPARLSIASAQASIGSSDAPAAAVGARLC